MQLSNPAPVRAVIPFPLRSSIVATRVAQPLVPSRPDAASASILLNAARVLGVTARCWWPNS